MRIVDTDEKHKNKKVIVDEINETLRSSKVQNSTKRSKLEMDIKEVNQQIQDQLRPSRHISEPQSLANQINPKSEPFNIIGAMQKQRTNKQKAI